jgi:hypothetical protein
MQFVKIVSITTVLKSECVNIRIAKCRKQLNGENIKQADVALNRNIVLFLLITTKIYDLKELNKTLKKIIYIHIPHDNIDRFLQLVFR